jgi:hypothetical protein
MIGTTRLLHRSDYTTFITHQSQRTCEEEKRKVMNFFCVHQLDTLFHDLSQLTM